jgi:hypothetical protein
MDEKIFKTQRPRDKTRTRQKQNLKTADERPVVFLAQHVQSVNQSGDASLICEGSGMRGNSLVLRLLPLQVIPRQPLVQPGNFVAV